MSNHLPQRLISLSLSLLLTVAMLGGIGSLSQRPAPADQWAQKASHQA